MADAIEKILKDENYGRIIGANFGEWVIEMMDSHVIDQILSGVYEKLLTSSSENVEV